MKKIRKEYIELLNGNKIVFQVCVDNDGKEWLYPVKLIKVE